MSMSSSVLLQQWMRRTVRNVRSVNSSKSRMVTTTTVLQGRTATAATRTVPLLPRTTIPASGRMTMLLQRRSLAAPSGGYPGKGGVPQSMQAELWQGHSKIPEGWEFDLYATYTIAAILIGTALALAPDTSIQSWAYQEAKARLELKAQGFDAFEFGTHYHTTSNNELEWDKFNAKAIKPGEDDDDEEEEEEEEDEEEEDDEEE